MALAIIGDGQLVAVGKAKTQDPDKPAAPKKQRRSNRVKDPKKIQPKVCCVYTFDKYSFTA